MNLLGPLAKVSDRIDGSLPPALPGVTWRRKTQRTEFRVRADLGCQRLLKTTPTMCPGPSGKESAEKPEDRNRNDESLPEPGPERVVPRRKRFKQSQTGKSRSASAASADKDDDEFKFPRACLRRLSLEEKVAFWKGFTGDKGTDNFLGFIVSEAESRRDLVFRGLKLTESEFRRADQWWDRELAKLIAAPGSYQIDWSSMPLGQSVERAFSGLQTSDAKSVV